MKNFDKFGFKENVKQTLTGLNFQEPTQVQEKVIPLLSKYQNVICTANTGTGKTHAFLLPIINNIDIGNHATQALIIAPTRELANQIYQHVRLFSKDEKNLSAICLIGGKEIDRQISNLQKKSYQIIIGTPTRIVKLFQENLINFQYLKYFIIDECDMIFDLGFIEDVDYLLSKVNVAECTIGVFSATISENLKPFLTKYLENAPLIDVTNKQVTNKNIEHILIPTKHHDLGKVLLKLIKNINPYLCLIFVNKKAEIEFYYDLLINEGYKVAQLHANLESRQRSQIIKRIKSLDYQFVVASDVASRGIDIDGVSHIISIDLPHDLNYYIHRSGRTGRANYTGYSYILYDTTNLTQVKELEKKGIIFKYKKWSKDNVLVDINSNLDAKEKKLKPIDPELQKIIGKYRSKSKVKPGYKKKRKLEISEYNRKKRRAKIKESIEKIKKQKAKQRKTKLFD